MNPPNAPEFLSARQAARALSVARSTVCRACLAGIVPGARREDHGGGFSTWLIPRASLSAIPVRKVGRPVRAKANPV